MTEIARPSEFHTGALWLVLAILLGLGTVAGGVTVYGILALFVPGSWILGTVLTLGGGFAALVIVLLMTGILYRVDRFRGVPHREVRLFE